MAKPSCQGQVSFIKYVRRGMDADTKQFLRDKDWRNIQPKSPRQGTSSNKLLEVKSFYLKHVACFVPHVLIPGHVPFCLRCKSNDRVDTQGSKVRWIKMPKTLFGTHSHRYLDTKFYWYQSCRRRFAGYDKGSMQLSAKLWLGFFPFNLSDRFAVDDELYSFVISSANEKTSQMHNKLQQMATDKCYSDCQHHLYLVCIKRIRASIAFTGECDGQRRINSTLKKRGKESDATRRLRLARDR